MNNAIKAALCSALIFPGAGHLLLKHYLAAVLLAAPSLIILLWVFNHYWQKLQHLTQTWLREGFPPSLNDMLKDLMNEPATDALSQPATWAAIFAVVWLIGIISAAISGHLADRKQKLAGN